MGFKSFFKSFMKRFFNQKSTFKLGIYGPPNAGKTSLANWVSKEFTGEELGVVSKIPHETREVTQGVVQIEKDGKTMEINLIDTPGISTKVDFEEFLKFGVKKTEAKQRAREATKGIIEAIKWLDDMDVVLAVMDSTKDPYTQVNITILGNLEARGIPVVVVANKTDLKSSKTKRVISAFPQYKVIPLSAKKGEGFEELYNTLFEVSNNL